MLSDSGLQLTSSFSDSIVRSQSAHHESKPLPFRNAVPEASSYNADYAYVPLDKSPSLVLVLNEKLDMQSKVTFSL